MHTDPWKPLRIGAPLYPRTMTLLVSVATASAFAYAAFVTIDHQTALATAGATAGGARACGLTRSGGGARCWAHSGNGRSGHVTGTQLALVDVTGLISGATARAVAGNHACAGPRRCSEMPDQEP